MIIRKKLRSVGRGWFVRFSRAISVQAVGASATNDRYEGPDTTLPSILIYIAPSNVQMRGSLNGSNRRQAPYRPDALIDFRSANPVPEMIIRRCLGTTLAAGADRISLVWKSASLCDVPFGSVR